MTATCPYCNDKREVRKPPRKGVGCKACKLKMHPTAKKPQRYRTCSVCGDVKKVKSAPEAAATKCMACKRGEPKEPMVRTCIDCGDVKTFHTSRESYSKRCKICSAKFNAKSRIGKPTKTKKVKYFYFCRDCSHVKVTRIKHRVTRCQPCSRRASRKINVYFDLKEMKMIIPMRYFRLCPHCPEGENLKRVKQSSQGGIRSCNKHKYIGKEKEMAAKEKKRKATLAKTVSERKNKPRKLQHSRYKPSDEAIEKIKAINKKHREDVAKKAKKPKLITQTKTEEEMMAEWLAKNEVTVITPSKNSSGGREVCL